MDHQLDLILTLAGALTAALLFGLLAHKLRLSPIVGYLAAGIAVGPFTPGFVAHGALAHQFAELGVVLLMFGVGLNLHVHELLAVRRVAVPGALLAMLVACGTGVLATRVFGWSLAAGVVYGVALSVASTVVLLRVFADSGVLHAPAGHIAIGWLLVEDLFVVLVVVLLPIFLRPHGDTPTEPLAQSIAFAVLKIVGLVVFTLLVGRKVIPRVLGMVARTRSRELFTLTVLVIALGVAVFSAKIFGASMALGAFLAGLVVGQSDFASRAASEALPMRDAFAVLFFVSTGMLLDPRELVSHAKLSLVTLAIVGLAKPAIVYAFVRLFRYPAKTALTLAFGFAQIGEFSFMVANLGDRLEVLPKEAMQALVAASFAAITLNPFLVRLAAPLASRLAAKGDAQEAHDVSSGAHADDPAYRSVVVGYGPIGKSLVRLLVESGLRPTVIEMNHETIGLLRASNIDAIYGDASQREILERARVQNAGSMIFTASGASDAAIRTAKALNPNVLVLARSAYLRDTAELRRAGANEVVSAEGEVALSMAERLLGQLGASSEQLDRARDRVRKEMNDVSEAASDGEV